MNARTPKYFRLALKKLGFLSTNNKSKNVELGLYKLADNPILTTNICDEVAQKPNTFFTYIEYLRLQNTPLEKPIEPDPKDPIFWPSKHKLYSLELIKKYSQNGRDGLTFLRATERANNYNNALKNYEERNQSHQKLLLQVRRIRSAYSFDKRGYMAFVLDTLQTYFPDFSQDFFFTSQPLKISEEARKKHTFITGGTGAGKSEIIKHHIRHYLTKNTEPAIVVLDPHGDLAEDVARFKENAKNDRLIYVYPGRFKDRDIAFNPFDFPKKDEVSLNRGQIQFLGALEQMIGQTLTPAQRAILTPCLGVLLHKENATLKDLVDFMSDDKNTSLVKYGATNLPNEQDREFFKDQFYAKNFQSTKDALKYRLNEIVRDPSVRNFLCNDSTFNLIEALAAGKIIVFQFNQDKQSKQAIKTIGQLMTAYITSYAMGRSKTERRPIHLFADECQYFVSPTIEEIMGESRKFGLYATLATQRTEQVGRDLLDAIFGNVGCYLIGRNKAKTADKMAKELPLESDDIKNLPPLNFYQVELDRDAIKTKIDIIGDKFALKNEAWRAVLLDQGNKYYRTYREAPEYNIIVKEEDLTASNFTRKHSSQVRPKFTIPDVTKK